MNAPINIVKTIFASCCSYQCVQNMIIIIIVGVILDCNHSNGRKYARRLVVQVKHTIDYYYHYHYYYYYYLLLLLLLL
jgi:hypothetical protein